MNLDQDRHSCQETIDELQTKLATLEEENTILNQEISNLLLAQRSANDGAWVWNIDIDNTYLSPTYKRLLGYQPHEVTNDSTLWMDHMLPEEHSRVQRYLNDFFGGNIRTYELDHQLQLKNGEIRWFRARGNVVEYDDEGKPICMAGTLTDITEQREVEQQARLFQTIAESAPDPIRVADEDGFITYLNPAYRELAVCGDEMIGQHIRSFFPDESADDYEATMQEVLEHGFWQGLLSLRTAQGEMVECHVTRFAVRDEKNNIVSIAAILRNLSEQQRAEQERQELQDQLIQAQQNAIRELSSPLIPLSKNLLLMPLIGSIDSNRAQMIMETLLEGVAHYQADKTIVDITGVSVVDTQVANAIVQAAQAIKLLGAQTILTGIGPTMAQTLIHLGADLSSIVTYGNLQQGIAAAMQ